MPVLERAHFLLGKVIYCSSPRGLEGAEDKKGISGT